MPPSELEVVSSRAEETTVPANNLELLSRSELYQRAQAAGIRGRSRMSRTQLIAALRASREPEEPGRDR